MASLITHYEVYSPGQDNSTLTTPSFTPANGEVIVVKLVTWDTSAPMGAPTGGGQTYNPTQISAPGGFKTWSATYTCTVSGSPAAFSISSTMPGASTRHSMVVERWSNASLAATPNVFSVITGSAATLSAPINTSAPNSVVSFGFGEINSRDPAGRTWSPVTVVEDGLYDGHVGSNSVQYFGYAPFPTAGAQTIGLTVPAGTLSWTISGVEILDASSEKLIAADLSAMGTLNAPLVAEARVAAALSGNGVLSAGMVTEARAAAALSASGVMTARLASTTGPQDPIGMPVAQQLLACLTDQMNTLPSPPAKIQLRAGGETGPLIGPDVDECCAGLAWVRIAEIYPSWDNFPAEDNSWLPCGPLAYAVVLEMGTAFCMPWSSSEEGFEDLNPPSDDDWFNAATTAMQHQTLMRRAAACCFLPTQRRAVGGWQPLSVEGGCTGGTLKVTVSVMAPCGDC